MNPSDIHRSIKVLQLIRILQDDSGAAPAVLRQVVASLPHMWPYADEVAARIEWDGEVYATPDYAATPWLRRARMALTDGQEGMVEVCYRHHKPEMDEPSFVAEERDLLAGLAEVLSSYLQRRQASEAQSRAHDELETRVQERTAELSRTNAVLRTERELQDVTELKRAQAALADSEARMRAMLEHLPVGVWFADGQGRITYGNETGRRIWAGARYVGLEQIGEYKAWWRDTGRPLAPEDWAVARAVRTRQSSSDEVLEIECFDGTHKIIRNSAVVIPGQGGDLAGVVVLNQDITASIRAEEERERLLLQLQELLAISHDVASKLELGPLLDVTLDRLQTMVGCSGCAIYLLVEDALVAMEYHGPLSREEALGLQFPWQEAVGLAQAIREREPVIIDDVEGDSPLAQAWRKAALPQQRKLLGDARSWMAVPLVSKDQVIGILRLDHRDPGHFEPRHARLAMTIANQAAVAVENTRLYERAQQMATIEERQRIARELHDSVSQVLYSIVLAARTARTLIDRDPSKAVEPLDYVFSLAEAGLAEMRALIFELRPDALQSEGLVRALERRVEVLRARHGLQVSVSLCEEPDCSSELKDALYRIAQEAMHNTARHARATRVQVSLVRSPTALKLQITDDGIGFDPTESYPGHMGLRSMRERVAWLGGKLSIESAPGGGTRLDVEIPI